ncbi:hypothetical protein DRE_06807 [Drechslerella stenobrocha 248]|uniref:FAS1 domain-containing protein n=1 Tax=Drechslerella stenobrocha 248 TaxID=1043628 RepID=W7HMV1_9PEZI|nr:hypothetical protein DRE_06807 [Drechslerella stenobrocha 248]
MHCKRLVAVGAFLASTASAQTLLETLQQQPDLSLFTTLVSALGNVTDLINRLTPEDLRTVLVPNNEAITSFMAKNNITSPAEIPSERLQPFLNYHVLTKNISKEDFEQPGGAIVETQLKAKEFALLKDEGGQVVFGHSKAAEDTEVAKADAAVEVKSGLGESVKIVKSNIQYDGGQLHVVDGLLTLPINCSRTISHLGAEKLVQYIRRVDLLDALDGTPGATCFAPSDSAIQAALPVLEGMTDAEIIDAIHFHILLDPYYTSDLRDGQTVETALKGRNVTVNIRDGKYFFNGVMASSTNDIVRNGVAYVLDGIMPYEFNGTVEAPTSTSTSTSTIPNATGAAGGRTNATVSTSAPSATDVQNGSTIIGVRSSVLFAGLVAVVMLL